MIETPNEPIETQPRSVIPVILLAIFAPALFCGLQVYHYILWSAEQTLSITMPLFNNALVAVGGMAAQAVMLCIFTGLLWGLTRDARFRPVYAGWFGASLVAFPTIALRFLGPHNDQVGSLLQIAICLLGAGIAWRFQRGKIQWNVRAVPVALMAAAIGIFPLMEAGALGSPTDFILDVMAGLSLGLFASLLFSPTTENVFLDAFGYGGVLALLGSALGYDGGQLILLGALPMFAFALSAFMPSAAGAATLTGIVAAAALAFIDPTELSLLLSDFTGIGLGMAIKVFEMGLIIGLVALVARAIFQRVSDFGWKHPAAMMSAGLLWIGLLAMYLTLGHRGFYGDRLFVIFKAQADLSGLPQIQDRNIRLTTAYEKLTAFANESQSEIRANLDTFGVKYTQYYLENALEVQGGMLVRLYLTSRPEVARILPSPRLRPIPPDSAVSGNEASVSGDPQWNIEMIGADKVWEEFDARGAGIVVGQSDSGVDGAHPAISEQYRGREGGDDFNWFDPWDRTATPNDETGHGTHTLGTILGRFGIGIAPEAQWIGCINLDRNLGNPALYLDCLQFMLAPFPQDGDPFTDGDPIKAAHVLNNSWGCPDIEGCDETSLQVAVENLRAAGIFVVASAGNDGPECNTVREPLALYDAVFSVGAVDRSGDVVSFSSRGPVTADGSGRMKPDIAAPGHLILSAQPFGTYGFSSGTSMAGPHVVGAVALLWSAVPSLIGDIDRTEEILIASARPYTGFIGEGCFEGGSPNAAYGYGILDVYSAIKMALEK